MVTLQCLECLTSTTIHLKLLLKLISRNTTGRPELSYQLLLMSSKSMMILSSTIDVWRNTPLPLQAGRKSPSVERINQWSLRLFIKIPMVQVLSSILRNSGLIKDTYKTKWRSTLPLPNLLKSSNTRVESRTSLRQSNSATSKPLSETK